MVAVVNGKDVADPVARHDVKECAQYMCPAYPTAAETFMVDGCDGNFDDYILELAASSERLVCCPLLYPSSAGHLHPTKPPPVML